MNSRTDGATRIWLIVAGIIALNIISAVAIVTFLPTWDERAHFGSMFGATSSLFSGLALAGVVYAILRQRQELALQRQELELTRAELARSAKAQEESAALLQKQVDLTETHYRSESDRRRSEALPRFGTPGGSFGGARAVFSVVNYGASISDVRVVGGSKNAAINSPGGALPTGGKLALIADHPYGIAGTARVHH